MAKKIISMLLTIVMLMSMTMIAFAATPTITVSSTSAAPGETVTLNVSLSNNPGINTFSFGFDYDTTRLNLTNVKLVKGIPGQFTYAKKAVWLNSEDIVINGNYLTLTFDVLDGAVAGDARVNVTYNTGDIANYNEEDVGFQVVAGTVTVMGNASGDGEITVGTVKGAPGSTITVPVSITKNPGINTFSLGFDYDMTKLELTDVDISDKLDGQFTYAKKAVWLNSEDTTYTGEILTLTFNVLEAAVDGEAYVSVTYSTGDISNYNEDDIFFDVVSGKVTVQSEAVYDTRVSLGKVTGRPGETVSVYISLDKDTDVKSMSVSAIEYDSSKVTLTKGEWIVEDYVLANWNATDEVAAVAFAKNKSLNGRVFLLTFTIKEGLEDTFAEINCNIVIKAMNSENIEENISVEVVPGCVNILNIIRGDVDGDSFVDSNDAIHLLYHTLLPDDYKINQNGDFDGDGYVDSNDAIHLLYFTLLPENYPLA